jgi:hypothetical protein
MRGGSLRIEINRANVLVVDLRRLAGSPIALPGLKRRTGQVGFQAHTGVIRMKDVEIKATGS